MKMNHGIPPYDGGTAQSLYVDGVGIFDGNYVEADESYMLCVAGTNQTEFDEYLQKLGSAGYSSEYGYKTARLTFAEYTDGEKRIYAYYNSTVSESRIILDVSSEALNGFGYKCGGDTVLYQYGVPMAADGSDISVNGKRVNCGQMYVIKLGDNSLFVIDGEKFQAFGDDTIEAFHRFLCEITGSEKLCVRCWFISHAHNDHFDGFCRYLCKYHDSVIIERVMYNFPTLWGEPVLRNSFSDCARLGGLIKQFYPSVRYIKPHTGHRYEIGSVKAEVLYTHEDAVIAETGLVCFNDFNNTTTVLKITFDNKIFMLLGDINRPAQAIMLRNYTEAELKGDIVQVAHHTWNNVTELYRVISASVALFPQSSGGAVKDEARRVISATILEYADKAFYAGDKTVGVTVIKDEIKETDIREIVGGDYTGWSRLTLNNGD